MLSNPVYAQMIRKLLIDIPFIDEDLLVQDHAKYYPSYDYNTKLKLPKALIAILFPT